MTFKPGMILFFGFVLFALAHGHSHSGEPPHLKYTREVNEAAQKGLHVEPHGHTHGPGCSHGHSHNEEANGGDSHSHTHSHSHSHGHSHGEKPAAKNAKEASNGEGKKRQEHVFHRDGMLSFLNDWRTRLWVYSIGSTLLISAFPCLILAFIPIQGDTDENSTLLKLLLAFGAGGLLGDAFLHLIPHATPPSSDSHSHSHSHESGHAHEPHDMSVGQYVLTGFMVFFIVEKFVRIMRGDDSAHSHSHSHEPVKSKQPGKSKKAKDSDASDDSEESNTSKGRAPKPGNKLTDSDVVAETPRIRVAAYLNLVADFMHNFTDGLAIGASFLAGSTVGIVTMITVLVHEVPHEIGDFAILIRSGYSKGKAMLIQLCTAGGALAGCILSLWSVDTYTLAETAGQSWVLPFTAGGFIYIATVSVIPELLERSTFWQSVRETCAILLGVFLMYLIAFYE